MLEARVVATGQPLEYNPYQRVNRSGADLFGRWGRFASAPRIRVQAKVREARGGYFGSSGIEAAEMEMFNIDGEVMLKGLYGGAHFFGRHEPACPDDGYGRRTLGRHDKDGVLEEKAKKLAKELQAALDEAGLGVVPPVEAVTLREIREDYRHVKQAYSSACSARNGLRERTLRHVSPGSALHDLSAATHLMAEWLRSFDARIEELEASLAKPEGE